MARGLATAPALGVRQARRCHGQRVDLAQPQEPEAPIGFGALSLGHCRSQIEPPPQSIEQLPVHLMWHIAPPEQSTLPLLPTVSAQVDEPVHLRLQESPHCPVQSFVFEQSSEQLFPHVPAGMSHD